jgi:hypothetical protein
VEIFRIYDVEAAQSNFTSDFEVFLEWDDPAYIDVESKGRNSGCFDIRSDWEPDWYPALLFHNLYDRLNEWCRKFQVTDREVGRIVAKFGYA